MEAVTPIMTARRDLWAEAVATLSDKDRACLLSDKDKDCLDAERFGKGSIASSVLQKAEQKKAESDKKMWSFSFKGKKILVRDVLQSILSWTKKFEQVAEFVVGLDVSGHAAIPWSAIKFFLDVAGSDFEKYGAMLVGMDFVAREINFYTIFEVYYIKKPSDATEILSQSLIKTYAKLLGYLSHAKQYYSDRTFIRTIKAPFDDGGVDGMMTDVGNCRTLIEQNARLIDKQANDAGFDSMLAAQGELKAELDNWAVPFEKISLQVNKINDATEIAKTKEILDWISLIRYEMHHERAKDGLLENSGLWLLNHDDFNQWKCSPKSSILWLQGILGSGKTKLSALVAEILTHTADGNFDPVAYFYCMRDSAEPERADPTQILRCIAQQLAYNTTASALRPAAIKKYEHLNEGGIRFKQLDLEQSAMLILDLTEGLTSVTIIVDAMDECENIPILLAKLGWILEQAKIPIRIFIASRNLKAISIGLEALPSSIIEMGQNSGDISLFVRTEVEHAISQKSLLYGEISPESKQKIIETLTAGAQGMFRWASLQLESLKKLKSEENVIKELSQLPPTLSELYGKIYGYMSETDTFEVAVKALRLLACSRKPITTSSFLMAVCTPHQKAINSESLVDYCSNLIVEDKALDIFRFAHLSVREYLETRDDFTPSDTHAVAAEICLTSITKARVGARDRMIPTSAEQPLNGIFEYATMFWPVHCGFSGQKRKVPPLVRPISSFIMQRRVGNSFTKWMEDARTLAKSLGALDTLGRKLGHCFCSPPNPFFLACAFGLSEAVECSNMAVTERSESGLGGLHLACIYGHEQVVRILLVKGADADSRDTYGRTPLFYATEKGHSKVIQVLLDHDKDIEISPEILLHAAYMVSSEQEDNIFELLLSRDGKFDISREVLRAAVTAPTKILIESLWSLPQDIEVSQEMFNEAAFAKSTEVLLFLLDQHEEGTFETTLETLEYLMCTPDTEALDLLLPSYPVSQMPFPEPVIYTAAQYGGLEPLKVLSKYSIDKGFKLQISQDAFEQAASNSSSKGTELIDFLRGTNTDLHITTETIVSAARNKNHEQALQLVKYFHAQNPAAEITDAVIERALTSGNGDLLKYLLETFKQLKVTRELVKTAAGSSRSIALVEVLLDLNQEVQVDEELLEIAAGFADKQVLAALFERSKGCLATEKMVFRAVKWGTPETVEFFVTKVPDLQITDSFIIAVIEGHKLERYSKELLQIFCDRAKDFRPTEDVAIAAAKSKEGREILGYLIARYGSVPITDAVWKAATREPYGRALEFLIGLGIKPRDMESIIVNTAVLGKIREVELLLIQAEKEVDPEKWLGVANLFYAIQNNNVKKVQGLISRGVLLRAQHTELGWTPLSVAARYSHEEIVRILIQSGKVDLEAREEDGTTFLCRATRSGSTDIVKMLLDAGADPKTANDVEDETDFIIEEDGPDDDDDDELELCF